MITVWPGGHAAPGQAAQAQAKPPARTQLAAFTVTKQANGDVKVVIRQFSEVKGVAATLRADGVPAFVAGVSPSQKTTAAACQREPQQGVYRFAGGTLIIKPSAIPSGSRLVFMDVPSDGSGHSAIYAVGHQWFGFDAIDGRDVYVYVYVSAASPGCPIS